jgi:hypothetical protein
MSGYYINNTLLAMQPTTGRWIPRATLGIDGAGHPIYPAVREFEMKFNLQDPSDAGQLENFFLSIQNTGTVVVTLPHFPLNSSDTYHFFAYTGCVLQEPEWSTYFTEHYTDCTLLITGIRT